MEKIIRLTESDLKRVIKKILNEQGVESQLLRKPVSGTTTQALRKPVAKIRFSNFQWASPMGGELKWLLKRNKKWIQILAWARHKDIPEGIVYRLVKNSGEKLPEGFPTTEPTDVYSSGHGGAKFYANNRVWPTKDNLRYYGGGTNTPTPTPKKTSAPPPPPSLPSTPIAPQLKGKKIDLYYDVNNTKPYAQVMISNISNNNGDAVIYLGINKEQGYMVFSCKYSNFTYHHPSNEKIKVFNKKFSDELKKLMCVVNDNGIYVPKADYTSISPQTKNNYIA